MPTFGIIPVFKVVVAFELFRSLSGRRMSRTPQLSSRLFHCSLSVDTCDSRKINQLTHTHQLEIEKHERSTLDTSSTKKIIYNKPIWFFSSALGIQTTLNTERWYFELNVQSIIHSPSVSTFEREYPTVIFFYLYWNANYSHLLGEFQSIV